jgi:hypothetical protein
VPRRPVLLLLLVLLVLTHPATVLAVTPVTCRGCSKQTQTQCGVIRGWHRMAGRKGWARGPGWVCMW